MLQISSQLSPSAPVVRHAFSGGEGEEWEIGRGGGGGGVIGKFGCIEGGGDREEWADSPPPHAQHIALDVKSLSSDLMPHRVSYHAPAPYHSQSSPAESFALPSVSAQVGGGGGGGEGGGGDGSPGQLQPEQSQ